MLLFVGGLFLAGCSRNDPSASQAVWFPRFDRSKSSAGALLFEGLGNHHRKISTQSELAQKYFDQGLIWTYAFNHDEAIRSFEEAARLDPTCAICWWGVALCHGPHINNPVMTPERSAAAWKAYRKAVDLIDHATPTEQGLIHALGSRYADPPPADRKPLDENYAQSMRQLWYANKNDPDVGTLFAEAMMDLRPWNLWQKNGEPQPGTPEILLALEDVQRLDPNHPGGLHLYIHAVEASPDPHRAVAAAQRLRNLVPASGHLVHMPSHIDVLTGRWALASQQNEAAIEADRRYRRISPRQDFYRVYMAHNHHMLAFASMMEGRREAAVLAAREMVKGVPEDYARTQTALVDPVMAIPYEVLVRFGRWDEVLRQPPPPDYLKITTTLWRFTRGVAYAAKGRIPEALAERERFKAAAAAIPPDAMMAVNKAERIVAIAGHMLDGEIAYRRGSIDEAVAELEKAIAIEDDLVYMEPPEWVQPVRHTLGAVLVDAQRYAEAEKVYRADLAKWLENGWSLFGLETCLRARGATAEADDVEKRFQKTWSRADTQIGSSCLCVRAKS
jgi:tetratricopeptide (TPR) repeat protein